MKFGFFFLCKFAVWSDFCFDDFEVMVGFELGQIFQVQICRSVSKTFEVRSDFFLCFISFGYL